MNQAKTVAITGAAGALGSALTSHLYSLGYSLVLIDGHGAQQRLDTLITNLGERAKALAFDVADQNQWQALLPTALSSLPPLFGAVLVAGTWRGGAPVHDAQDDGWQVLLSANLQTVHASMRALLPGLVERKDGSVVVIGSRAVERPWTSAGAAAYAATKAGAVTYAQAIAEEVRHQKVRVNAVLPSTIDTAANRSAMPDADPSAWVSTESLSQVIAFLLSEASRDVSGATLPVYGRA